MNLTRRCANRCASKALGIQESPTCQTSLGTLTARRQSATGEPQRVIVRGPAILVCKSARLARLPFAPFCISLEEQSLTQHCRNCRGLERFGNEEGRLRPLACQEAFGICRDE